MKLTIGLSESGIQSAIEALDKLQTDIKTKTSAAVLEVMKRGVEKVEDKTTGIPDCGEIPVWGEWDGGSHASVNAGGEAVFAEFGTGVRYNGPAGQSPHPKGEEHGYLIGEYGLKQGRNPEGWDYTDASGNTVHTYGIPAQMFMYNTARELEEEAPEIVKKVFET